MRNAIFPSILIAFVAIGLAMASEGGRKNVYVDPVYIHEGDAAGRTPFAIDCSSTSWTTLVATDSTSRSVLFIALDDNAGGVCISTTSTSGVTCTDSTNGPELKPGASLTDYTTGAWNCRSRANNVDTIKGYRSKHSED